MKGGKTNPVKSPQQATLLSSFLPGVPDELREICVDRFNRARQKLSLNDFDGAETESARFAEAVVRLLEWHANAGTNESYTPLGTQLPPINPSWVSKCESQVNLDETLRFHIPRLVLFVLGVRNKRGIAHLSKIDTNHIDAVILERSITWIMAELIRLHHKCDFRDAQSILDKIVEHSVPVVWTNGSSRKVLRTDLKYADKVLVLLAQNPRSACTVKQILSESGYSHSTHFRSKILVPLDKQAYIHFDTEADEITLTPKGMAYIENNKLLVMPKV